MQLAVGAPVWGRLRRTELFWLGVTRLREQWAPHPVRLYVSGDEPEQRALAARHDGTFVDCPNVPLGTKFNVLAQRAYEDGCDYFMVLGSDDLLSPQLARDYRAVLEDRPFYVGCDGLRFLDPLRGQAVIAHGPAPNNHRQGEVIGPGRMLSRTAIEGLWHNRQRPLEIWPTTIRGAADWWMTMNMRRYGILGPDRRLSGTDGTAFLVDIKGTENMWKYTELETLLTGMASVSYEQTVQVFPAAEQRMIRELADGPCPHCGRQPCC